MHMLFVPVVDPLCRPFRVTAMLIVKPRLVVPMFWPWQQKEVSLVNVKSATLRLRGCSEAFQSILMALQITFRNYL